MKLLLDTTVLSRLCHPARAEDYALGQWFDEISREEDLVCLPEITDYETRRGLVHIALRNGRAMTRSLRRLDQLGNLLTYLPLTTAMMRRAARLWAEARFSGLPTGSSLDADAILAAQALEISGAVVTDNLRHLGRFVPSYRWQDVPV
jgi:predicted nucleic acid-binding protein